MLLETVKQKTGLFPLTIDIFPSPFFGCLVFTGYLLKLGYCKFFYTKRFLGTSHVVLYKYKD